MASCTHKVTLNTTTNSPAGGYTTGAFTPADGDILVVFTFCQSGTTPVLESSVGGQTFTLVDEWTVTFGRVTTCWVSDQHVTATSQTVTYNPGGSPTGCIIFVNAVSGIDASLGGATATRQTDHNAQTAGNTPVANFPAACLTGNPTLAFCANASNPASVLQPTGWTEQADVGFATPTTGGEYATRNSGFTGTDITWGGTSASAMGTIIIELDASAPAVIPSLVMAPPIAA